MGQLLNNNSQHIASQYFDYTFQEKPLSIKISSSIKEPDLDMPNQIEVNQKFKKILSQTDQPEDLLQIDPAIKWNLIQKHSQLVDSDKNPGALFAYQFNSKCQLSDLVRFYDWLDENDDEAIQEFILKGGINILMTHLAKAQEEAAYSFDFNHQVMILKVLESLFTFDSILEDISSYQNVLNQIISNLSPLQVEVDIIILELFTYIAWNCDYQVVTNALKAFKDKKKFNYLLEPFVRVLEDSKNIVLINNCIAFINVLLQANKNLEKRVEMQESLLIHGISVIYGDIRLKIQDDEFSIIDCTFEEMIRQIKRKRLIMEQDDDEIEYMVLNSNEDRTVFLEIHDTDEFLNQQQQLLTNIEAFEELMNDQSESSSQYQSRSRSTSKVASPFKSPIGSPRMQNVRRAVVSSQLFNNNIATNNARHTIDADQIQDVDQLHRLFKDLKHCKSREDLLRSIQDYIDSIKTVTVVSKIIESLKDNFIQFTQRKDLEQQIDDLQEKGLHLELEISKLSDEKRTLEEQVNASQRGGKQKQQNTEMKQIDVGALREKIQSLQKGLLDAHSLINNNQKLRQLYDQVGQQKQIINQLKQKLSLFTATEISNENLKKFQEEMRQNYETKITVLEQALKRNQTESKFRVTILSKAKENMRKKLEDANQKILKLQLSGLGGNGNGSGSGGTGSGLNEDLTKSAPPAAAPPPPPPPPAGPPPPPPGPGGMPPPPPMANAYKGRVRKQPSQMMKSVYWKPLKKENVKQTIWDGLDDSQIQLDCEFLEENFCQKKKFNQNAPVIITKPIKESSLRPDRQRNIELVLSRLKMSNTMIVRNLFSMEIDAETVERLLTILPQDGEIKSKLAVPDLFYIEISKVPGYAERLQALESFYNYKDTFSKISNQIEEAKISYMKSLRDNQLKTFMLYLLAVGNFFNGTTNRGDSYGFKLSEVDKLLEIKPYDHKQSLMMYVVKKVEQEKGETVDLNENLKYLEYLSKFQMNSINLGEMKQELRKVQLAIDSQSDNEMDKVKEKLGKFPEEMASELAGLQIKIDDCKQIFKQVCDFYCEKDIKSEDFYSKMLILKEEIKNGKQQLIKMKEWEQKQEEKKKIQEMQKLKANNMSRSTLSKRKTIIQNLEIKDEEMSESRNTRQSVIKQNQMMQNIKQPQGQSLNQLLAMQRQLKKKQ